MNTFVTIIQSNTLFCLLLIVRTIGFEPRMIDIESESIVNIVYRRFDIFDGR